VSVAVVFLATYCLPTGAAAGTNIYVTTNGAGPSPFGTWATATSNIQWAVNAGINGDTVWISNGVYVLTNQITVTSNITISGIATGAKPVVDGTNGSRCFEFTSAATGTLANLFITRGYADSGAGLYMRSGTVRDCIFSNNNVFGGAGYGGGGAYFATVTNLVQSCTFVNNTASNGYGGGMYIHNTLKSIITGCAFRTNLANNGGGIYKSTGNNTIITNCDFICNVATDIGGGGRFIGGTNNLVTHCTFDGNVAMNSAGGMYMSGLGWLCSNSFFSNNIATNSGGGISLGSAVVKNCVIARNTSRLASGANNGGGGINMIGAGTLAQNCVIEENWSGYWGGGVWLSDWSSLQNCLIRNNVVGTQGGGVHVFLNNPSRFPKISSCTIVSNYAGWGGGGINDGQTANTARVDNCIIYFNKSGSVPAYSNLYDKTVTTYSNCCVAGFAGAASIITANLITADPQCVGWTNSNYRLSRNSLCINAGVNRDWMTGAVDFDGYRRVDKFSGGVDIGCYEYLPSGTMFTF